MVQFSLHACPQAATYVFVGHLHIFVGKVFQSFVQLQNWVPCLLSIHLRPFFMYSLYTSSVRYGLGPGLGLGLGLLSLTQVCLFSF